MSISLNNFVIQDELGKGSYGTVLKAHYIGNNKYGLVKNQLVALKKTNVNTNILKETQFQKIFNHPNIVKMYLSFINEEHLYLVMELVDNINLEQYLKSIRWKISIEDTKVFFKQIVDAIEYCHSIGLVHLDIKPDNIMITKNNILKLTDFGTADFNTNCSNNPLKLYNMSIGTMLYKAPELFNNNTRNTGYRREVDIFSLGVILIKMLCGEWTNSNISSNTFKKRIIPKLIKKEKNCIDLLLKMLEIDVTKRITIEDVKTHPFLEGVVNPAILGSIQPLQNNAIVKLKNIIKNSRKIVNNLMKSQTAGKKLFKKKQKTYMKFIKGVKRIIHIGPKGGKYYIHNKRKIYI